MLLPLAASAALPLLLTGWSTSADPRAAVFGGGGGVQVTAPDGAVSLAALGEHLQRGDRLAVGSSVAEVTDGARVTFLAPHARVVVNSPDRYSLLEGALAVRRGTGPPLTVTTGGIAVTNFTAGAVRVQRDYVVRVSGYNGSAQVQVTGRTASVTPLTEMLVAGYALPGAAVPLALADDALDVAADPSLVALDEALRTAARGIDDAVATGARTEAALLYSSRASFLDVLPGAPLSEALLPLAIARASGGPVVATYRVAHALREEGASWGVVAKRLGAQLGAVEAVLARLEDLPTTVAIAAGGGQGLGPAAGGAGGTTARSGGSASSGGASPGGSSPGADAPGSRSGGSGRGSGASSSAGPTPSPSPSSPSPGLLAQLLNVVDGVLSGSPSPAPTPTATATSGSGGVVNSLVVRSTVTPAPTSAAPAPTPTPAPRDARRRGHTGHERRAQPARPPRRAPERLRVGEHRGARIDRRASLPPSLPAEVRQLLPGASDRRSPGRRH